VAHHEKEPDCQLHENDSHSQLKMTEPNTTQAPPPPCMDTRVANGISF
jgi:hypothetical protein